MAIRGWPAVLVLTACGQVAQAPHDVPSEGGRGPAGTPPEPSCKAADHSAGPAHLENASAASLGPCGELLYSSAEQKELWLQPATDGTEPQLLTNAWLAGRARFSLQGDRLYYAEQNGGTATLSMRSLVGGDGASTPGDLAQVAWCGGRDVVISTSGTALTVLDADLQALAAHDFAAHELVAGERDCKALVVQADTVRVLALDDPARPPQPLPRRVAPDSQERFSSLPYQPLVLHESVRHIPCGDTTCPSDGLTELLELRQPPRALLTSREGPVDSHLKLSTPAGDSAIVQVGADYYLARGGKLALLGGLTPAYLLRDQVRFLALTSADQGEPALVVVESETRSELVARVAGKWVIDGSESSVLATTLPAGVSRLEARTFELTRASLPPTGTARVVRQVPSGAELLWTGSDGRCLLRVVGDSAAPPAEAADLATAGDYLLSADGSVMRRWPRGAVLAIEEALSHALLVSSAGACVDAACEQREEGGIELVSESGEMTGVAQQGPLSADIWLDTTGTRYLIRIDDEYWAGQLGTR